MPKSIVEFLPKVIFLIRVPPGGFCPAKSSGSGVPAFAHAHCSTTFRNYGLPCPGTAFKKRLHAIFYGFENCFAILNAAKPPSWLGKWIASKWKNAKIKNSARERGGLKKHSVVMPRQRQTNIIPSHNGVQHASVQFFKEPLDRKLFYTCNDFFFRH